MTWVERLSSIAEWLINAARCYSRYGRKRGANEGLWEFTNTRPDGARLSPVPEDDGISPNSARISRLPAAEARAAMQEHYQKQQREKFAEIRAYPFRNSLNLVLRSTDASQTTEIPIVVYFGRPAGRRPSNAKDRERRAALRRAKNAGKWQVEVLYIDVLSRKRDIVEQLAAFLSRRNIYDASIQKLWKGFESVSQIDFIDPRDARSFPAYKRVLRMATLAHQAGAGRIGLDDAAEGVHDWRRPEDSRPELRSKTRTPRSREFFSVTEAAKLTGIPRRTLYDRIKRGKIQADRSSGFVRITHATLDELAEEARNAPKYRTPKSLIEDPSERHQFIKFLADKRGISHPSARKHVSRLLAHKPDVLLHLLREFKLSLNPGLARASNRPAKG